MSLSDEDVEKIVDKMIQKTQEKGHTFWIDPEDHYNSHRELSQVLEIYNSTTSSIRKTFIGLLIVGAFVLAALPFVLKKTGA